MRSFLLQLVPAALLLTLSAGDAPAFKPAEGAKLETTWTIEASIELGDLALSMGGQEMGPEEMGIPSDLSAEGQVEIRWLEHYVKMDGSRPLEIVRTVRELRAQGEASTGDSGEEDTHDLVDKPVRFRWNADEERYEREWVGEAGEEDDLEHLAADADLRGLLPSGPVDVGASWEVHGKPLLRLLIPLFELEAIGEDESFFDGEEVPSAVLEALSGLGDDVAVVCTWRGASEVDGRTLGRIELAITLDESVDIDPSALGDNVPDEVDVDPITISLDATLTGYLDWDLAAGAMATIELQGTGSIAVEVSMSHPQGFDMSGNADASFELEIHGTTLPE